MRSLPCSFVLLLLALSPIANLQAAEPAKGQPIRLFNGTSLDGWNGDAELWSVDNGIIVGTTDKKKITKNSFLATKQQYANFVLRVKFKLRNHNSGVQFRSAEKGDHVVQGYQADIAEERFMGILYEEGGRGILADVADAAEVKKHLKPDDWNEYVITVDGGHIVQQLNGFTTVDYQEKSEKGAKRGIIALQLHTGPSMEVQFKDIELTELP